MAEVRRLADNRLTGRAHARTSVINFTQARRHRKSTFIMTVLLYTLIMGFQKPIPRPRAHAPDTNPHKEVHIMLKALINSATNQPFKIYTSLVTAQQVAKKMSKKGEPFEVVEVEGGHQILNAAQIAELTAPEAGTETGSQEGTGDQANFSSEAPAATATPTDAGGIKKFGEAPKGTLLVTVPGARLGAVDLQVANFMGLQRWWKVENYPGIQFDPATGTAVVPMTARQIKARKGMEPLLEANLPSAHQEPAQEVAAQ